MFVYEFPHLPVFVCDLPQFSGTITVAEGLDRESVDVYKLVISAKDGDNQVRADISPLICIIHKALST